MSDYIAHLFDLDPATLRPVPEIALVAMLVWRCSAWLYRRLADTAPPWTPGPIAGPIMTILRHQGNWAWHEGRGCLSGNNICVSDEDVQVGTTKVTQLLTRRELREIRQLARQMGKVVEERRRQAERQNLLNTLAEAQRRLTN